MSSAGQQQNHTAPMDVWKDELIVGLNFQLYKTSQNPEDNLFQLLISLAKQMLPHVLSSSLDHPKRPCLS